MNAEETARRRRRWFACLLPNKRRYRNPHRHFFFHSTIQELWHPCLFPALENQSEVIQRGCACCAAGSILFAMAPTPDASPPQKKQQQKAKKGGFALSVWAAFPSSSGRCPQNSPNARGSAGRAVCVPQVGIKLPITTTCW